MKVKNQQCREFLLLSFSVGQCSIHSRYSAPVIFLVLNFSFWLYHSFNNISTSSKLSKSRIASIGTLPPQSCSQSYRRLLIYDLKRTLTAKEFSVIYALIFKELSVAEIAEKQGISRQAVNQMKNSAIKKLRSR